ncbi:hypothetical protein [Actinoplanes sp. G11-F43]|uniref:hypothetical protein n=1 Tax=Actinoplanes sp. G11-F43 TaxID=3424130 RepID=UPI003D33F17B
MSIYKSIPALSLVATSLAAASAGCSPARNPTTPSTPVASVRTDCTASIDQVAEPSDGYRIVAGNVALPPGDDLLDALPNSTGDGPVRMFAKWGLLLRTGSTATLSLSPDWAGRARIGWGGTGPVTTIELTACPPGTGGGGWSVFAGGTWVAEADCVPIHIVSGNEQATVEMSVGAACARPGG